MKITKTGSCKKGGLCVGISLKGILHCIVYRNTIKVAYFSLCLSLTLAYLPQDIVFRMNAQWLLYIPLLLTCKHSAFCTHTVYVCLVRISEPTATVSLYVIN
jgi:hypothetical protein